VNEIKLLNVSLQIVSDEEVTHKLIKDRVYL